jgi:nickel transport protein
MNRGIVTRRADAMQTRLLVLVAAAVAVAVLSPGRADAHALELTVRVPPDAPEVTLLAAFDDDMPAKEAEVVVTDAEGKEIAKGKTDEKGVWKFAKPASGTYFAVVEASGHKDRVKFEVAGESATETEYTGWRPDRTLGLVLGVGGLLLASAGFWWLRLRKPSAPRDAA